MKKTNFLLCFLAATVAASAQAKRYVLLEHFTNSNCSNCKSKSPAFFSLVDQYINDVHHISYHPSFPYSTCIFYQANTVENTGRTNYYNVNGTPRVALNGTLAPASSQLLPPATLQAQLGQTSPLYLSVQETENGNQRTANISVRTEGTVPAGTYKLLAAVVEKKVDYTSPIGYSTHRNVFRKMLPALEGADFTPAAVGQSVNFSYTFTLNPNWVADSIYVVAFIQNTATKEVLNSGTKFDPLVLGAGEVTRPELVQIQPNPVTDVARVLLPAEETAQRMEVFSLDGRLVASAYETQAGLVEFAVSGLAPGVYVVKIAGEKRTYTGKFVK